MVYAMCKIIFILHLLSKLVTDLKTKQKRKKAREGKILSAIISGQHRSYKHMLACRRMKFLISN